MYKIYANNICIHNGLSQDPTIKAAEATLTEEDNRSGSLEFKIAPSNIGYKSIIPMATTIVINKVDSDTLEETSIWVGRVTQKDIDFYNCESCYCEGALSFLVDTFQEKETFEGTVAEYFEKLLSTHNKKVSQNRRIKLGTIQADPNLTIKVDLDYANTLECINTGVIEPLKGHIEIEIPTNYTSSTFEGSPTLNYYKDWKPGTSQNIDFGKNLLDMSRNFDVTDLVTAIYPRGASITDENGIETVVDISSVNDGSKILINEELRSKYGYIEKVVDFSDIEDPQKLLEAARLYFTDSQFDDMSIEVSAFDMSYLRFGQQTEEVYSPFRLLEKVHCISTPHGLDRDFPVTKIVTDILDPTKSKLVLNNSKKTNISSTTKAPPLNTTDNSVNIIAWHSAVESYVFWLSLRTTTLADKYGITYSDQGGASGIVSGRWTMICRGTYVSVPFYGEGNGWWNPGALESGRARFNMYPQSSGVSSFYVDAINVVNRSRYNPTYQMINANDREPLVGHAGNIRAWSTVIFKDEDSAIKFFEALFKEENDLYKFYSYFGYPKNVTPPSINGYYDMNDYNKGNAIVGIGALAKNREDIRTGTFYNCFENDNVQGSLGALISMGTDAKSNQFIGQVITYNEGIRIYDKQIKFGSMGRIYHTSNGSDLTIESPAIRLSGRLYIDGDYAGEDGETQNGLNF